ncbi:MAG: ribosome maturation factor RimM [Treponema sp.]|nr:ribosome maturation factor RimM [Treponema sp.]MCL2238200.1 ribosome maturation factor RimM [Treponema sp.]
MTDKFIVGIIGAPFGVKGFVKVRPLSGETAHLLKLESVTICKDGKEQTLYIEESSSAGPAVHLRFKGIDSPEAAKTLTGAQLIVDRDEAAPLAPGEYYIEDLKGLPVLSDKDELLGHITDIIEGGGGELIEIELADGIKKLVPFRKDFFPEISLSNGKVVLKNLWILE